MHRTIMFLAVFCLAFFSGYAQYDLGDTELNASLTSIMDKFKAHTSDFRYYVTGTYKIHPNKYDFLQSDGMNPNDIYLAAEIAKVTKKSVDDVISVYKKNKGKGWGVIAKESGLNAGTPAFESFKDDAYKLTNGTARPRPKPVVTAKPATKNTTKTKPKTASTSKTKASTTKPKTSSTTKPKAAQKKN